MVHFHCSLVVKAPFSCLLFLLFFIILAVILYLESIDSVTQVFEVNTSDQRDGKHLLTQLQEATQSHQLPRTALAPSAESHQHHPEKTPTGELLVCVVFTSQPIVGSEAM